MLHLYSFPSILPLVALTLADMNAKRIVTDGVCNGYQPFSPCYSRLWGSWTHGPECKTDTPLTSILSRITNPPAIATSYEPSSFCSEFLRQTDITTILEASTGISTYTTWTITHEFATVTDTDHPTSTKYCAIPSQGMTCGISNPNIIAGDQQEDWSIEHYYNPEECQQVCLEHPLCKAYRVVPVDTNNWHCEIFNVGLGVNGSNVISASKGNQWWDRDCPDHLPIECKTAASSSQPPSVLQTTIAKRIFPQETSTIAVPRDRRSLARLAVPANPAITPGPILLQRAGDLAKRDTPLPPYLSDLSIFWSYVFVVAACSCLITSALPGVNTSSTSTYPIYSATTTVSSTYVDLFTVTETPRSTTIFQSIN